MQKNERRVNLQICYPSFIHVQEEKLTLHNGLIPLPSVYFHLHVDLVALRQILRLAHDDLEGQQVTAVLGEQGGLERSAADPRADGDHAPAIRHEMGDRLDLAAGTLGHSHEEVRRGSAPEEDGTAKLDLHEKSISAGMDYFHSVPTLLNNAVKSVSTVRSSWAMTFNELTALLAMQALADHR